MLTMKNIETTTLTKEVIYNGLKKIKTKGKYDAFNKTTVKYLNIPCAFDIETTNAITDDGELFPFTYEWTFGYGDDKRIVLYGRELNDFMNLLLDVKKQYKLGENKRMIVYVHNLSFEFQYIKDYVGTWDNVFAPHTRKPIYAITGGEFSGFEFRDSQILSGFSLDNLAKNCLVKHDTKKLVGNLDYNKVRHSGTPLTIQELEYCENDVQILLDYISEMIEQNDGDITKIPLTNTGKVRRFMDKQIVHASNDKNKRFRTRGKKLIDTCVLTLDQYNLCKQGFMGGFTHGATTKLGVVWEDVSSVDITSSYPTVMLSEKFPMGEGFEVDDYEKYLNSNEYACLLTVEWDNIDCKWLAENFISESKCLDKKGVEDMNGRVYHADHIKMVLTDVDFNLINMLYEWDSMEVTNCLVWHKEYLPKEFVEGVWSLYLDKTTLKGVKGQEAEYMLKKGMLNSTYGMCVTDILQSLHIFDENNEWKDIALSESEQMEKIDKINKKNNRTTFYPWGVWVRAYARANLINTIEKVGEQDYIYADTDSIKLLNYEEHKHIFEEYNEVITKKIENCFKFHNLDYNIPKTRKGVEKPLGVWDYEGTYDKFKTLGAKRYMVSNDDVIELTVAGLPKSSGKKYLDAMCETTDAKFEMFADELEVPEEWSGKLTHTYVDTHMGAFVTDYLGNKRWVECKGGVHLRNTSFSLNLSSAVNEAIALLFCGKLVTGYDVKPI